MPENFYPTIGGVIVDMTGVGSGVGDRLVELDIDVGEFWAGGKPDDTQRFLNARAEVFWFMRVALERGRAALPDDPELFEELLAIEWKLSSSRKIQIISKDILKVYLGRSPNRADAVAMAFHAAAGGGATIGGSTLAL